MNKRFSSRFEQTVSRGESEADGDFEDGVVRFVLVLVVALQQVLALSGSCPSVLGQVDLHKAQLQ